jgi:arylsulfatase
MQTPNFDELASEGMYFTNFYGQPSCTPGRAAIQTGRNPNRSGMTTVAFQGQGGGLPEAEWTLASVLKEAGYNTYFTGKWHLGESDYALPNAQGYDQMKYAFLYHMNAYTYPDPAWHKNMPEALREEFAKITKGSLSGNAGEEAKEDFKVIGDADTPDEGKVGIKCLDAYVEKAAIEFLEEAAKTPDTPFFINVNFMKNHQPNLPHPDFEGKSIGKSKYSDSVVELDTRVGNGVNKLDELGLKDSTVVFYTVDNGAWQDVYPDSGYTPFRSTKATDREGGSRVPSMVRWPAHVPAGSKSDDIVGGLDLMATFASLAGQELPKNDRDGEPMIFDSYVMTPIWTGKGDSGRTEWFYFTGNELSPGVIRVNTFKYVFNLRGDDGTATGSVSVDTNLGWKCAEKYVATMPQVFDLLADPQERYDIFMTTFTESTWAMLPANESMQKIMKTYIEYPPRKLQSETYTGPITLSAYQRFKQVRDELAKDGVSIGMPTGN